MDMALFARAMPRFSCGVLLLGLLLFVPAGTLDWWQGWLLMGVLFIPMFVAGLILMKKSPELLRKRLSAKEEQAEQRSVVLLSGLMFIAAFVLAGLNRRFHWLVLPDAVALYAEVLRENVWLSRTVEVQENQRVVDTRLYGVVRHPMYMSTLLLFLSMPLILGSILSFVVMLAYFPIIRRRILNEESVLEAGLAGYREYEAKVRWRVIPYVW